MSFTTVGGPWAPAGAVMAEHAAMPSAVARTLDRIANSLSTLGRFRSDAARRFSGRESGGRPRNIRAGREWSTNRARPDGEQEPPSDRLAHARVVARLNACGVATRCRQEEEALRRGRTRSGRVLDDVDQGGTATAEVVTCDPRVARPTLEGARRPSAIERRNDAVASCTLGTKRALRRGSRVPGCRRRA